MAEAVRFHQFTGHKGCVYHAMVNIVAPFKMAAQILP